MRRIVLVAFMSIVAYGAEPPPAKPEPAPAPQPAKKWTIGVSLEAEQNTFCQEVEKGMKAAAAELAGIELDIRSADLDLETQVGQVDAFIAKKVDAIALSPVDPQGIGPAIRKANAAKIPVFIIEVAVKDGAVVSHIGSDCVAGGRLAGLRMARLLHGQGDVIVLVDRPAVSPVQDMIKGFVETAEKSGLTVLERPLAEGKRDKVQAVMEVMLEKYPMLNGVLATNDECALGALDAVQAANRTDMVIVGSGASSEARKAILSGGPLKADIIQFPVNIGRKAVETMHSHLSGTKVPGQVLVNVGVVDGESLAGSATSVQEPQEVDGGWGKLGVILLLVLSAVLLLLWRSRRPAGGATR